MATQKSATSRNGALWVIALSLVVIATCLVFMVVRQHQPTKEEISKISPSTAGLAGPNSGPVRARVLSSNRTHSDGDAKDQPARENADAAASTDTTQPELIPVAAREQSSYMGLAPLTFLGTNDGGTITGKVTLKGTPPPERAIKMDEVCGRLHKTPLTTRNFVVSKDGGLANVFVYIKGRIDDQKYRVLAVPAVLNQSGCEFQPLVVGLVTEQRLVISNSDRIFHNVDAITRQRENLSFNIGEGGGGVATRSFAKEEIGIRIKCDVHPWMEAHVCVLDHPFFAVTDTNGDFVIRNVPPGEYKLNFVHFKGAGFATFDNGVPVSVKKGEHTQIDFEWPLDLVR